MTTFNKITIAILVSLSLVVLSLWFGSVTDNARGSIATGDGYQASQQIAAGTTTLKTRGGSIGSVVISNAGATGKVIFYDTAGNNSTTTSATTTTLFSVAAASVENTYVYDVSFVRGLLVEVQSGFDGDYVITYK